MADKFKSEIGVSETKISEIIENSEEIRESWSALGNHRKQLARNVSQHLKITDFKASNGWLEKIRLLYNISFKTCSGESNNVNLEEPHSSGSEKILQPGAKSQCRSKVKLTFVNKF